ncbi:MAG: type I DNA topoisomerase [Clostridia bacterium]
MKLVIVESPSKAKTVAKYLSNDYIVDASGGHIRDLPEKKLAVDIANNFEPIYEVYPDKKEVIARLVSKAKKCDEVLLATDPDREGEAISWHLQHVLKLSPKLKNRITFNEISKKAVENSIKNPDFVNINLVNAQQARRVLDRLVGYKLSPVLCKKIQPKLSAGRVQSATLKIVVDREREINSFIPEEFWTVSANLQKLNQKTTFKALLTTYNQQKLRIASSIECQQALSQMSGKPFVTQSVKRSITTSSPFAPFTTSSMQQDAVNKLKMSSKKCMQTAQQLYEGIDVNGEHTAYVTYIRTDSVRVSADATNQAREYIALTYGKDYIPEKPNFYSSKKSAQDAHEAIRPINPEVTPELVKNKMTKDQYQLYKLIYDRFLASCASKASYDSLSVVIDCNGYGFKASGKTVIFDGYTKLYNYSKSEEDDDATLPNLSEGEVLKLVELQHEQKFTKPLPRYTEASIIKTMEDNGIGRPSTYTSTLSTLFARKYLDKDTKSLIPTSLGITVIEYLEKNFADIINIKFTAQMEDKLDTIEEDATVSWQEIVGEYYKPLAQMISKASTSDIAPIEGEQEFIDCESCGGKNTMAIKVGRFGRYYHCETCGANKSLKNLNKKPPEVSDKVCDKCGAPMLIREGRMGKFLACSAYPKCKNTISLQEYIAKCPKCGNNIIKRLGKSKAFYGCSAYPTCDYVSWDMPTDIKCPNCQTNLVIKELQKGKFYSCPNKECDYKKKIEE